MMRARCGRRAGGLAGRLAAGAAVLLLTATLAFAQASGTTASLRGTVEDTSGGVLPGATVTLTNAATRGLQVVVTNERGGYLFSGLFPGTYELKVELEGFKTHDQRAISLSPGDTRGLDVRLDVGDMSEVITVTRQIETLQTETGAREGVLTAAQIENLSVTGRSSLELLRILPGVVAPPNTAFETVTFGDGANATQMYTVNGIRGSNNTVQLDGSALIDIGSNNGVIVTLNNDMVQEVKVQSSNFAAEFGSGGMSISAVTKGGGAQFSGTLYDYVRHHRFAARDRSAAITGSEKPRSSFTYPGGNLGGPILLPGTEWNRNRDKAFFFVGLEVQRQKNDPGARFGVVPTLKQRDGDFSEFLSPNGANLRQNVGPVLIPAGLPGAGTPVPGANLNNCTGCIHPLGRVLVNAYPLPNHTDPDNEFNYVLNQLEANDRVDMKTRFDYNVTSNTKAYLRVAYETEDAERHRGVWWGASDVALPSPNVSTNKGRSWSGNVVTVLSPTMTNEALVSWSRLTLDNAYKDPAAMRLDTYGVEFVHSFPGQSPYLPGVIPSWGGGVSNLWSAAHDMFAHNDALQFSNKLTKIAGAHGLKFGVTVERLQKQQNFNFNEEGNLIFAPGWTAGSTTNTVADIMAGVITQMNAGTKPPAGEFRMWNLDLFAQDSWKLRPNLTLEFGVRAGYWTNNRELNGLGGYFDPALYDPNAGQFLDPGTFTRLNGVRYVSAGQAPAGILQTRDPFAMPRVNAAWDIDGQGTNVLRGGYGLFFNRNMGNVEYDNTLRLPPTVHSTVTNRGDVPGLLNYDTARLATLEARIGSNFVNTLDPNSFTFPKTHSFSVSYARRVFFDQVAEVAYVGTRGRDLVSRVNKNAVPEGALLQGTVGNADLSNPTHRFHLTDAAVNSFRPFAVYPDINTYEFEGVSDYNSLQVTLSRQTGRRIQYFANYTLSRTKGTLGDEYRNRDPFRPERTYGIRAEDRTHTVNVSWNLFLPDAARGALDHPLARGVLNGWQLSGISSVYSGIPIWLGFAGPAGNADAAQAWYGTPDAVVLSAPDVAGFGLAPVYTCDPRLGGTRNGEKMFDINCIGFPAMGQLGEVLPPYDLRSPTRQNHDLTLFKNFQIHGEQKLQLRFGFFNIFNQAFAFPGGANRSDVNLTLNTVCNRMVPNVPNGSGGLADGGAPVCDPTGGFSFDENTRNTFGTINLLRGRRIVEFALKYYF